jgi:nitroreductase
METFESIEKRRSVRKFDELPVEWEKVGNILRAAQLAPSSGNVQDCKFVVVTDKTKRAALANAALKQHWIANAPVIIVIYSEPKPTQRFYGLRGEKLYTIQNSAAAAENMLLAATDQGLASCWVGAFDENMVNRVLGAPDSARPQAMIPIGYSSEEPKMPRRNKLVDLTYINSWGGKLVNVDLLFDDFSEVVRRKLAEAKEAVEEKAPTIAHHGKEKVKKLHEKIKERMAERKKKKAKKLEKELGGEEEVLEDTDL